MEIEMMKTHVNNKRMEIYSVPDFEKIFSRILQRNES